MYITFEFHKDCNNLATIYYNGSILYLRDISIIGVIGYVMTLINGQNVQIYIDIACLGVGLYEEMTQYIPNVNIVRYEVIK